MLKRFPLCGTPAARPPFPVKQKSYQKTHLRSRLSWGRKYAFIPDIIRFSELKTHPNEGVKK